MKNKSKADLKNNKQEVIVTKVQSEETEGNDKLREMEVPREKRGYHQTEASTENNINLEATHNSNGSSDTCMYCGRRICNGGLNTSKGKVCGPGCYAGLEGRYNL